MAFFKAFIGILVLVNSVAGQQDDELIVDLNRGPYTVDLSLKWIPFSECSNGSPNYTVELCSPDCSSFTTNTAEIFLPESLYYFNTYHVFVEATCPQKKKSKHPHLLYDSEIETGSGGVMPPKIDRVVPGAGSANITWTPHSATADVLRNFVFELCRSDLTNCREEMRIPKNRRTQEVHDLIPGLKYTVSLTTVIKYKGGEFQSNATVANFQINTANEDTFPRVKNVNVKISSNGTQATISFEKPNTTSKWLGSLVQVMDHRNVSVTTPMELDRDTVSTVVGPLPLFSHLRAEVQALYYSDVENETVWTMPAAEPFITYTGDMRKPEITLIQEVSDTQILVEWSHFENESVEFNYTIHLTGDQTSNFTEQKVEILQPSEYHKIVDGLLPETTYTVSVTANIDFNGTSYNATSEAKNVTTLIKDALKPMVTVDNINSSGLSISWDTIYQKPMNNCTFSAYLCDESCRLALKKSPWSLRNGFIPCKPFQQYKIIVGTECLYRDTTNVGFNSSELPVYTAYALSALQSAQVLSASDSEITLKLVPVPEEVPFISGYMASWKISANEESSESSGQARSITEEIKLTPLQPLTEYNISISALVVLEDDSTIVGDPYVMQAKTIHAAPEEVTEFQARQRSDSFYIQVSWQKPHHTQTELEYIVEVSCNRSNYVWSKTLQETSIEIKPEARSVDQCQANVTARTVGRDPVKSGPSKAASFEFYGLEMPVGVNVSNPDRGWYEFEIIPPSTNKPLNFRYQLGEFLSTKHETSSNNTMRLAYPEPFRTRQMEAGVCVDDFCGDYFVFNFTTSVEAPDSVGNLVAVPRERTGSLEISWEAPNKTNGPIDGYLIQVLDKETEKVQSTERPSNITAFLYESDEEYTSYKVSVQAFNVDKAETKLNGTVSSVSVTSKGSAAPPPEAPVPTDVSSHSLSITWTPSKLESDFDVTGFRVQYQLLGEDTSEHTLTQLKHSQNSTPENDVYELLTTEPSALLENLDAFSRYSIAVSSCSSNDTCGRSVRKIIATNKGVPSVPLNVSAAMDGSEVVVKWTRPEKPEGPLDGYMVAICPQASEKCPEIKDWNDVNRTLESVSLSLATFESRWTGKAAVSALIQAYNTGRSGTLFSSTVIRVDIKSNIAPAGFNPVVLAVILALVGVAVVAVIGTILYRKGWRIRSGRGDSQDLLRAN